MDCDRHGDVLRDIDRLQKWTGTLEQDFRTHCNGGGQHIYRREYEEAKASRTEEVRTLTEALAALRKATQEDLKATNTRITTIETDRQVEKAGMTKQDRWFVVLINAVVVIAAILLKAQLGG